MNYYAARQRQDDGRWDYTCIRDGKCWAVGYCHEYIEPVDSKGVMYSVGEREKVLENKSKYHNDGHATPEEAQNCYKQYLLDFMVRRSQVDDKQVKCEVCKEWTQNLVEVNHSQVFYLCPAHDNKKELEKLVRVGWSISSY